MIHDVEHLHAELEVEIFRDALNPVVLEDGEIEAGDARAIYDVAPGIATKVEAPQVSGWERPSRVSARDNVCRRRRITISVKECLARRDRNPEAVDIDVVCGISRMGRTSTTGSRQPARVSVIIAAQGSSGVATRPPSRGEGKAIAGREK